MISKIKDWYLEERILSMNWEKEINRWEKMKYIRHKTMKIKAIIITKMWKWMI